MSGTGFFPFVRQSKHEQRKKTKQGMKKHNKKRRGRVPRRHVRAQLTGRHALAVTCPAPSHPRRNAPMHPRILITHPSASPSCHPTGYARTLLAIGTRICNRNYLLSYFPRYHQHQSSNQKFYVYIF